MVYMGIFSMLVVFLDVVYFGAICTGPHAS